MTKHAAVKYWAVVPAAGAGKRMGADIPKQYLSLLGQTVLEHTLQRLLAVSLIEKVVVAVSPQDEVWPRLHIAEHHRVQGAHGGAERFHSVLNGLESLSQQADENDWVLVHDAARPCVRVSDMYHLIESLEAHAVGGLLAAPTRDTMKRADAKGDIAQTVDREGLWNALTPQMFRYGPLKSALKSVVESGAAVTDEAQAMELQGLSGHLLEGSRDNIKITFADDLELARFYLQEQKKRARWQQREWL